MSDEHEHPYPDHSPLFNLEDEVMYAGKIFRVNEVYLSEDYLGWCYALTDDSTILPQVYEEEITNKVNRL